MQSSYDSTDATIQTITKIYSMVKAGCVDFVFAALALGAAWILTTTTNDSQSVVFCVIVAIALYLFGLIQLGSAALLLMSMKWHLTKRNEGGKILSFDIPEEERRSRR